MFVKRIFLGCLSLWLLSNASSATAQAQPKLKDPLWTHAFNLQCRKYREADFTATTQKFGIEGFKDNNNGLGVFISQVGSLAAVDSGFGSLNAAIANSKGPTFVTGLDLPTRRAGQKEFKGAPVHSMEVFLDTNTNNWVYLTEKGYLAATAAKGPKRGSDENPRLSHSVDLGVRKGGDREWKNAKKFGVEVYFDANTGNLVYACETGSVAVIAEDPAKKVVGGKGKNPDWLHGLDLRIRKATEAIFSKNTKVTGVEVYRDANNDNLIFITEDGNLTVCPGPKGLTAPTRKPENPKWTHGINMRCRKAGETEFTNAQVFGIEVFRDNNVNVILYLAETGSLSAVKAPQG